jgi:PAS domain S-box-containing protein
MSSGTLYRSYAQYMQGGGELGGLTRSFNWQQTVLGSPEQWSQSLLTTVSTILNSRFPMFLWWGPELIQLYNDAYRPSFGNTGKHPKALGQRGEECWPEIWPTIKPLIDQVMSGGKATWSEDQLIPIYRNGRLEDVYWTFGYSKVYDDAGGTGGVLVICNETTDKVNAHHKLAESYQRQHELNEELLNANKELAEVNRALEINNAALACSQADLRRTLRLLVTSEDRFRNLIVKAPIAIAIFNGPQFVIELANAKVLEYWDRTLDQVIGKPLFTALPEAGGQGFELLLANVLSSGEPYLADEQSVKLMRNGKLETTWIKFIYDPLRDNKGKITGIMVICSEITEQVNVRKAIERAEEKLRHAVTSAEMGTWYIDTETRQFVPSARTKQLFGFHQDESMPYEAALDQVVADHRDRVIAGIEKAIISGEPYDIEYPVIGYRDQQIRWIKATGKVYPKENDNPEHFSGMMKDITERKAIERGKDEALLDNKLLLESIFSSTLLGIVVYKAVRSNEGDIIDFEFVLASSQSEGYLNEKDLPGKRLLELFPQVRGTALFIKLVDVVEKDHTLDHEDTLEVAGYQNRWVRRRGIKLGDGVVTSWMDTTVQKNAEVELQKSKDLLQAAFDTSLIAITLLKAVRDGDGVIKDFRIEIANRVVAERSGRNLVNKLYAIEYPGIKQTGLFEKMVQVVDTGEHEQLEYYYGFEGLDRWYSSMFVKCGDGILLTTLDITERKRAEEEKLKNLAMLQQAENIALTGSWDYSFTTGRLTWSDGMYNLFGIDREVKIQPEIYLAYATEECLTAAKRIVDFMRLGVAPLEETIEILVGDTTKTIHIKGTVIGNIESYDKRMIGADMDITAMRKMNDERDRLERLNKEIEANQNQKILQTILYTQEEERKRISESLHNGLGQILYGMKLSFEQQNRDNEIGHSTFNARTHQLLTQAIRDCRQISHELTPTVLEDFGLKEAIMDICRRFEQNMAFNYEFLGWHRPISKYIEITIYRTIQELVTNVVKHANATQTTIKVELKRAGVNITVQDNGIGFEDSAHHDGMGILSIKNKLKILNGKFNLSSEKGRNTIGIRIPFSEK